jgi:GWxTD domain-containing protein
VNFRTWVHKLPAIGQFNFNGVLLSIQKPCVIFILIMRNAFLLLFICFFANGQPLRDINYKYLYDGSTPFSLQLKSVPVHGNAINLFTFQLKDTTDKVDNYQVTFETRTDLQDKAGIAIGADSIQILKQTRSVLAGRVQIRDVRKAVFVCRVVLKTTKRAWFFYTEVNPKSPSHSYIAAADQPILRRYVRTGTELAILPDTVQTISYYSDDFPAGTPVFSESIGRVPKAFVPDTVFQIPARTTFSPPRKGLYLMQPDTTSERGYAFRSEDDYPRFGKIENLADPLIYICTRQEFEKIKKAKGDKPSFDRVILTITGERERAKLFMKTYFRRVEMANEFFTSYKEGWKTDRGMIYIIFGPPDEVYKFFDREVWKYDNIYNKVTFDFAKSATIFDPDNYVLVRDDKYKDTWYEAIDLRRNGQF